MVLECSRFRRFFSHTLVIYLSLLTLLFTKRNWGPKTRKRGYINLPAFYRLWCKLIVFSPCYLLITDSARSLTVCGCKQNKMKTSICLVANFWTASILQLKKLFYSFSQFLSRESGFELRFRQLSRDRNLESRMKIQLLNTQYVVRHFL